MDGEDDPDAPEAFRQHSRLSQHISFLKDFFRAYKDFTQWHIDTIELIRYPQNGVCLYKCGVERFLLEVHAPEYKRALYGTAGGR